MAKRKTPMRVIRRLVGYIRVSMKRDEMYSPAVQKKAILAKAKALGVSPENVIFVDDIDETGTTFDNRKIVAIVRMIEDGIADGVIVLDTSRWGRDSELTKRYRREINSYGGHYISATQGFDSGSDDAEVIIGFHELMDEQFSAKIGKGWERAVSNRRDRKLPHSGRPRLGYMRCPDCKRDPKNSRAYLFCRTCEGVLWQNPFSAPMLDEAYERRLDGESFYAVNEDLSARGLRSTTGMRMNAGNLRTSMDTGFAAGLIRWNVGKGVSDHWDAALWTPGKHKPIIKMKTWEAYCVLRRAQSKPATRKQTPKYSPSGLMRCGVPHEKLGVCRSAMAVNPGRANHSRSFRCLRCVNLHDCEGVSISVPLTEEKILKWLDAHAKGDAAAIRVMQAASRQVENDAEAIRKLGAEKARIEAKQEILVSELLKGTESSFPRAALEKEAAKLALDLSYVQGKLDVLMAEMPTVAIPEPMKFTGLLKQWPKMTVEKKNLALGMVIDHILVIKTPGSQRNQIKIVPKWAPPAERIERYIKFKKLDEQKQIE